MIEIPDFLRERGDQMFRDLVRSMKPEVNVTLDPFIVQPVRIESAGGTR